MASKTAQKPQSPVQALWKAYHAETSDRLKFIDSFLVFLMLSGIVQFIYCILVTNYPFNAFLAGCVPRLSHAIGCSLNQILKHCWPICAHRFIAFSSEPRQPERIPAGIAGTVSVHSTCLFSSDCSFVGHLQILRWDQLFCIFLYLTS